MTTFCLRSIYLLICYCHLSS